MINVCDSMNEAVDVVSSYISFCEDMVIPQKKLKVFPNNKPWITKDLKTTINKKKLAFQTGNKADRKSIQKTLTSEIRHHRRIYKEKIEAHFQRGNMADAWKGLKTLSGQSTSTSHVSAMPLDEQKEFSENLNKFYCRFEREDMKEERERVTERMSEVLNGDEGESRENESVIDESEVKRLFSRLNTKKAVGPDNISGRILKSCAAQLCHIFSFLFSWSLNDCHVPDLWKKSIVCPVPKKNKPVSLNDYRPVALTSVAMKCFERIILKRITAQTILSLDSNQFAYKPNRSTDDAAPLSFFYTIRTLT